VARRIESLAGRPVRLLRGPRLISVRVPRRDAAALRRRFEQIRGVRFVERNHVVMRIASSNAAQTIPTDPLWRDQWGPSQIGAPAAWAVTMGSPRVVIAVLDTGVDLSQPDLQGALVPGYNVVAGNSDPGDDNGHGTRTAGIVGARADNGVGVSGVCPRCSVMPVKVVGANGSGTDLDVASGITWATNHGAQVLSLSLGGTQSDAVAAAVAYAESKGVLVVAAAGNGGSTQPFYPAADPGVLSVAGTQTDDHLFPWSNYGSWVAVAAPGCDTTTFMGGGYGQFCGTSASTPVVAGLAGLALSYSPTSSADAIEHAIVSSAHTIDGVAGGRVDAARTLAALGATFPTLPALQTLPLAKPAGAGRPKASTRHATPGTRVRHRVLRGHWQLHVQVRAGRVAATLRSSKAHSCSLSLTSAHAVWLSSKRGPRADSLVARVPAGRYRVDVWCEVRDSRAASLTVRAFFHEARHGSRSRPGRIEPRGLPVRVEISVNES
jgi:Subtilase family